MIRTARYAIPALLLTAAAAQAQPPVAPGTWRVDPTSSELRVLLYRGGLLGRMGHNHVVAHRSVAGCATIADTLAGSSARLSLAAAGLDVDREDDRREEGEDFPVPVPDKDIAGTRENMLGRKLLDADKHPTITLATTAIDGAWPEVDITFDVTVAGQASSLALPVTLHAEADAMTARGSHAVTHGEIGLTPFSAALGALKVRDEMLFRYALRLVPAGPSDCEAALPVVDDDAVASANPAAE